MRQRMFSDWRIGTFLFVMAGVAFIDWVLILVFIGGVGFGDRVIPLTVGLVLLICPGNGYSAFCSPLMLFLLFAAGLAAVICVAVPFIRLLASSHDQPLHATYRSRILAALSFVASVVVTLGFGWSWFHFMLDPLYVSILTPINRQVGPFVGPAFILVSVATARYLWRSSRTD